MAPRTKGIISYGTASRTRRRRSRTHGDERPTLTLHEDNLDAALRRECETLGLRFWAVEKPLLEDGCNGVRYARALLGPGRVADPEEIARFLLHLEDAGIAYALRCTAPHRFGGEPRRLFNEVARALHDSSRATSPSDCPVGEETAA